MRVLQPVLTVVVGSARCGLNVMTAMVCPPVGCGRLRDKSGVFAGQVSRECPMAPIADHRSSSHLLRAQRLRQEKNITLLSRMASIAVLRDWPVRDRVLKFGVQDVELAAHVREYKMPVPVQR